MSRYDYRRDLIDAMKHERDKYSATDESKKYSRQHYDKIINQLMYIHSIPNAAAIQGKISNVGKKTQNIIDNVFSGTYDFSFRNDVEIQHPTNDLTSQLRQMHGFGDDIIRKLIMNGLTSFEDLPKHLHLLTHAQKIGYKYHSHLILRIPREEMVWHEQFLLATFQPEQEQFDMMLAGSYRREEETSGDIDLIVRNKNTSVSNDQILNIILNKLRKSNYIVDTITKKGVNKFMGICSSGNGFYRRIDILVTSIIEFPFALLYFTGCVELNISLRNQAQRRGMKLNEHGLYYIYDGRETLITDIEDEETIFNILGYVYPVSYTHLTLPTKRIV